MIYYVIKVSYQVLTLMLRMPDAGLSGVRHVRHPPCHYSDDPQGKAPQERAAGVDGARPHHQSQPPSHWAAGRTPACTALQPPSSSRALLTGRDRHGR